MIISYSGICKPDVIDFSASKGFVSVHKKPGKKVNLIVAGFLATLVLVDCVILYKARTAHVREVEEQIARARERWRILQTTPPAVGPDTLLRSFLDTQYEVGVPHGLDSQRIRELNELLISDAIISPLDCFKVLRSLIVLHQHSNPEQIKSAAIAKVHQRLCPVLLTGYGMLTRNHRVPGELVGIIDSFLTNRSHERITEITPDNPTSYSPVYSFTRNNSELLNNSDSSDDEED